MEARNLSLTALKIDKDKCVAYSFRFVLMGKQHETIGGYTVQKRFICTITFANFAFILEIGIERQIV